MADPYAAPVAAPAPERPAPGSELAATVAGLGGAGAASLPELSAAATGSPTLVAVLLHDEGLLPPVARIGSRMAVALLAAPDDTAADAAAAAAALAGCEAETFAVKEGTVAGPGGRVGALAVTPGLVETVLRAALVGEVCWERDPDFGYEVAAGVPGVAGPEADALCPRLLYAGADRVYEHAELVVECKRRRHQRLATIPGLEPELLAASGWPIEPTGQGWKD